MPIYKKVNKKFFQKWTPEMAYTLGFLVADGNVIDSKRTTWYWSLQITDKEPVYKIKQWIRSEHKISKRCRSGKIKDLYRIQIGSKEMCEDLIKLGVIPAKSKKISLPSVPGKFVNDFIRGYFDGDGNVWIGRIHKNRNKSTMAICTGFTSGCYDFLCEFRNLLKQKGLAGGYITKKQRGHCLRYSINDSLKLYEIMYNSGCISFCLKRKKKLFEKYKKLKNAAVV